MYGNLRILRESLGMTQKEFAASLSIGLTTYNGYETGARDPKSDFWVSVATKYHVTVDYLMGFSNDPHKTSDTTKNAPLYSSEALRLAGDYDSHMDDRGRETVRRVADLEVARYKEPQPVVGESPKPPKAVKAPKAKKRGGMIEIKVYDEPAAAGLGNYLDEPDYHIEQYPDYILPPGTDFGIRIDGDSMEPKIHDGYTVFVEAKSIVDPGQIGIFVLNGKSYCKKIIVDHERRQTLLVSINKVYEDIVIREDDFLKPLGRVLGQWGPGSREDDFLDW